MTMPPHDQWPAFVLPWDDTSPSMTDMSKYLEKPAGARGFIRVVDGHLATGDGRRWRAWGHMLSGNAPLPEFDRAPIIARRLAKFGINCVRLHHIDHRWPDGILMRHSTGKRIPGISVNHIAYRDDEPTRALDPEAMARLDWFIARCKENGIYIDLNLNVSRPFSSADGVKEAELLGLGKGFTLFDEQLILLQKEYAQQVLDHVNPFTGNRYADEPAIAIVEIVNENSLLEKWVRGLLVPVEGEERERGAWAHIPPAYARDLDRRWNAWLARRYDDREALATAWDGDIREYEDAAQGTVRRLSPAEFSAASSARFRDEARFLAEIERTFFQDMQAFLRGTVGVQQLILGTSDFHHFWSALPMLEANSGLDIMDGHAYWELPNPRERHSDIVVWPNTPMVDQPDRSIPARLSRSRVKGMPYIVSEVNEPFPHDYGCECIPIVTAYGLLQDWDGIMWCKYRGHYHAGALMGPGPTWPWETQAVGAYISQYADPLRMSQLAIGALMWYRADVKAAQQIVERSMPYDWALESLRVSFPKDDRPYWFPHLPGRLGLVHQTVIADFHSDRLAPAEGEVELATGKIVSDTGELTWDEAEKNGRVVIDTPRHQAVVMRAGECTTSNLRISLQTPFAAIQVASVDERPLAETASMLLVAAARVANTGMVWRDDTRTAISEWGGPPTRIEPVQGTLLLRNLQNAQAVSVQPLDGCGQPLGAAHQAKATAEGFVCELGTQPGTLWYAIDVRR